MTAVIDKFVSAMKGGLDGALRWFTIRRFRLSREKFYTDLAKAIRDKEPVAKFMSIRRTRAVEQKDSFAWIYQTFSDRLERKGGALSYMLQGIVPDSDILVVSSIEVRGDVDQGLDFLATTVKSQRSMKAEMVAAVSMPAVVLAVSLGFVILLSFFVIPLYETIVPHDKWDNMGKSIFWVSHVTRHYGIFIALAAIALGWAFKRSITRWQGRRRAKFDNYLPYRLFRDYNGSVFMVSLASLMVSGETLVKSLEKLRKKGKPWLRWHINMILKRLLSPRSSNYGEAFSTGIFSREISNSLIDDARRSADFNAVIKKMGVEGIETTREEVKKSAKSLNVALILVLGGFVGYLLLGTMYTAQGLNKGMRDSIKHHRAVKK